MKQSLQLGLGQNLSMTMQLQQAIGLLQLHSLELYHEIQNRIESNPFLEIDEAYSNQVTNLTDSRAPQDSDANIPKSDNPFEHGNTSNFDRLDFDRNSNLDSKTEVLAATENLDYGGWDGATGTFDRDIWETTAGIRPQSLQEYLRWQLEFINLSPSDAAIADFLIDSIDDDGFLQEPLVHLFTAIKAHMPANELEFDEVAAVLHRIQQLDPVAVGAEDLRECLLIQLGNLRRELIGSDEHMAQAELGTIELAHTLVDKHLQLLASRDYAALKRRLRASDEPLQAAISLIKTLRPKPGSGYAQSNTEYIVPDVFVKKHQGVWQVELNPDLVPKLNINQYYAGLIKRGDKSADGHFMRDNLQDARFFIKSLQSRNDTILKVAQAILQRQRLFFEYGEEAMQPMILKDIADAIDMHESTISRVTTQKYMHTPRGVYELKFFFSSAVSTNDGGECSAIAIRALIKKLIEQENPTKPLSDNKIASKLAEQGIDVARRTIAKYREAINIPSSSERRQQ